MTAGPGVRPSVECSFPLSGEWVIDPRRSRLGFAACPFRGVTIRGCFRQFGGSLHIAERRQDSLAELTIQAGSIEINHTDYAAQLVGGKYLNATRYPEIVLLSTALRRDAGRSWTVAADLILRDVGRPILLTFTPTSLRRNGWAGSHLRLRVAGVIDLRRWDVGPPVIAVTGEGTDATVRLILDIVAVPSRDAALRPWWVQPANDHVG